MGEFNAGKTCLWIVIYFFVFFTVVYSMIQTDDYYETDNDLSTRDVGFLRRSDPFNTDGYCDKPHFDIPFITSVFEENLFPCGYIRANDVYTCEYFNNCNWTNITTFLFFNYETDYFCDGYVNLTQLGFERTTIQHICTLTGLQNRTACETFGCTWYDYSELGTDVSGQSGSYSIKSISDTVLFVTGFKADLGVPNQYLWIYSFIFFWIPLVLLIISLYFALPFLH